MKLQAIKTLCVDCGNFVIINTMEGRQWIGNGFAFYPIEGINLTKEGIPALFDLTTRQVTEMRLKSVESDDPAFSFEPMEYRMESELREEDVFAWNGGALYRILYDASGAILINETYMKPARNKEDSYTFFARTMKNEAPVVAVYGDMFCAGLILPINTKGTEEILRNMGRIGGMNARRISQADDGEDAEVGIQAHIDDDTP